MFRTFCVDTSFPRLRCVLCRTKILRLQQNHSNRVPRTARVMAGLDKPRQSTTSFPQSVSNLSVQVPIINYTKTNSSQKNEINSSIFTQGFDGAFGKQLLIRLWRLLRVLRLLVGILRQVFQLRLPLHLSGRQSHLHISAQQDGGETRTSRLMGEWGKRGGESICNTLSCFRAEGVFGGAARVGRTTAARLRECPTARGPLRRLVLPRERIRASLRKRPPS